MSEQLKAVGVHVFAGGFTLGVRRVMDVVGQLEVFGLGRDTTCSLGINRVEPQDGWADFVREHRGRVAFCYGNPRCSSFSCVTGGGPCSDYSQSKGPYAKQTVDIRQLCRVGTELECDYVAWESVQAAYTSGRPLIDELIGETFRPRGYRVAHVFVNVAAFGSAQRRRRYFFVAHRGRPFNVFLDPADIASRQRTVRDTLPSACFTVAPRDIHRMSEGFEPWEYPVFGGGSEQDTVLGSLREGEDLYGLARRDPEELARVAPSMALAWKRRTSDLPFSLHCPRRLEWDSWCPTLVSSCCHLVHPSCPRRLTVGECSALAGWPAGCWPVGPLPYAQLAKGVVPAAGEWLARQVLLSTEHDDGEWSIEVLPDGSVNYEDAGGAEERVIRLTRMCPPLDTGD